MSETTERERILNTAVECVMTDRNATHGNPEDNFRDIARYWSTYLGYEVKPHDVAAMMILVKVSRMATSPLKDDHWIDAAGYAACGYEVATRE